MQSTINKSNMVQGVVKPEILRDAVRRYQEVYKTYDSVYGDNIPSEVYYEKLSAYQPYIRGNQGGAGRPEQWNVTGDRGHFD